ncbi:hypothetical protein IV203_012591 [Nitzschia inconspicua]|uniref:Uncharacterized protein n=1 Tax=Nitzschia inconspicua TaxID=303405 RepID=A0A9K3PM31_9STRA|nr:hypothetical protein IV203_012591 [Nitzschia inconspicua]
MGRNSYRYNCGNSRNGHDSGESSTLGDWVERLTPEQEDSLSSHFDRSSRSNEGGARDSHRQMNVEAQARLAIFSLPWLPQTLDLPLHPTVTDILDAAISIAQSDCQQALQKDKPKKYQKQ